MTDAVASRAVPAPQGSADSGVAWHYGDPLREQRRLVAGEAMVDLSHRGVVTVSGPDRLSWLHDLTTAHLRDLAPGTPRLALILDPHGHVEHELHLVDDGERAWITVEPSTQEALVAYLESMRFLLRVEIADVSSQWAVVGSLGEPEQLTDVVGELGAPPWQAPAEFAGAGTTPAGSDRGGNPSKYVPRRPDTFPAVERLVARDRMGDVLATAPARAGTWAWEACRVSAAVPRLGAETDDRTLPHEVGWIGPAVHLAKGCYRGQEAVARTHNMGRPPRRLVLLHLDGSTEDLPTHGSQVTLADRQVGWVGTAVVHYENGPIATAVVKGRTDADAILSVGPIQARQEIVVVTGR